MHCMLGPQRSPITAAVSPLPTLAPTQTETTSQPSLSVWQAARKQHGSKVV